MLPQSYPNYNCDDGVKQAIATKHSRSSKGLSRHTTPCDGVGAPIPPVTTPRCLTFERRNPHHLVHYGFASRPERDDRISIGGGPPAELLAIAKAQGFVRLFADLPRDTSP
jgi:hypothetical protein